MKENVLVSTLTTMHLGGAARYLLDAESVDQVAEGYKFAKDNGLKVFVLGGGSNILGRDEGYDGLVIRSKLKGIEEEEDGGIVLVSAYSGEVTDDLCKYTAEKGYTGIEALSGIPGLVGAAPVQNIGAYGQEISDTLAKVEAYDSVEGRVREFSKEECKLSYRKSIFNSGEDGRFFIVRVTLKLRKGQMKSPLYGSLQTYMDTNGINDASPLSVRNAVMAVRNSKLPDPLELASAGSFFKNVLVDDKKAAEIREKYPDAPFFSKDGQNKLSSGWLIEKAGLKGKLLHGMRVSDKAALVLINESANSYEDLEKAKKEIIRTVNEEFGVELEQEPVEMK